jgi:hypothetical protein
LRFWFRFRLWGIFHFLILSIFFLLFLLLIVVLHHSSKLFLALLPQRASGLCIDSRGLGRNDIHVIGFPIV